VQGIVRPRARTRRGFLRQLYTQTGTGTRSGTTSGVLHPGRHQVSRPDPFRQSRARSRVPPGQSAHTTSGGLRLAVPDPRTVVWVHVRGTAQIPRSFRFMEGVGSTRSGLVNATDGRPRQVHWKGPSTASVGGGERGGQDQRAAGLPSPGPWDAIPQVRSRRGEMGVSFADELRRPRFELGETSRRDKDHPRGRTSRCGPSAGWCSTVCESTTSSPKRAGGVCTRVGRESMQEDRC